MTTAFKASVPTWLCSISSVALCLLSLSLAVHGWILGESASISENSGPPGFEVHFYALGIVALFATWVAAPLWIGLLCFRRFRLSRRTHIVQAAVFGVGWLLVYLAAFAVESSPARHAF